MIISNFGHSMDQSTQISDTMNVFSISFNPYDYSSGSHYRLVGPFILPDSKQIMSKELIIDRWVALSAFKQLYRPKTDQFSSASTGVSQVDEV